jgi:choline kinase
MANSDYHVVLIAAGCSRRLAHLTVDRPKSFLPVRGKRIIDYTLAALDERGFQRVTVVTGYLKEMFPLAFGSQHGGLKLNYVVADDYETTGHGWSVFLTRPSWTREKRPVLLVHADVFFDPRILDLVTASEHESLLSVDENYKTETGDEQIVLGRDGLVTGVRANNATLAHAVGESVGINKWSPAFMDRLYGFMEGFFAEKGRNFNWEPVLDRMLSQEPGGLHYLKTGRYRWMNINYEQDYARTQTELYDAIYGRS